MNDSGSTVDNAQLDRLVDGELAGDERRALLATLERSPDGWRRCALAFVESQVVGECLDGLTAPPKPSPAPPEERPSAAAWWAIAAAVLAAFGLGLAAPGIPGRSDAAATIAEDGASLDRPPEKSPTEEPPAEESLVFWAANDGGDAAGRRAIHAPLIDADAVHQRFGVRFQSSPPGELLREFEQRGYRLSTQRRFAPLYVSGDASGAGRPIVVPVDDVRVVPIRNVSL